MRLVLATRNEHKLREFRVLLDPHELIPLPDDVELPPETGETFEDNARVKAEAAALDGRPGVRSARYADDRASDEENLAKLLDEVPDDGDRRVSYVCALAYAEPGAETRVFTERCEGELAKEPRGDGGFGYDPAFVPVDGDDGRTMAELSVAEKDAVSHRGRAARAFLDWFGGRI